MELKDYSVAKRWKEFKMIPASAYDVFVLITDFRMKMKHIWTVHTIVLKSSVISSRLKNTLTICSTTNRSKVLRCTMWISLMTDSSTRQRTRQKPIPLYSKSDQQSLRDERWPYCFRGRYGFYLLTLLKICDYEYF